MSKRNPRVHVLMSCGHLAYWHEDSARGDARVCYTCRDVSTAVEVYAREWQVRCQLCHYGRFCGQDQGAADRLAARHNHSCVVFYQVVEPMLREPLPITTDNDSLTLFDIDTAEPPPF